jgi:hypothetical protein
MSCTLSITRGIKGDDQEFKGDRRCKEEECHVWGINYQSEFSYNFLCTCNVGKLLVIPFRNPS